MPDKPAPQGKRPPQKSQDLPSESLESELAALEAMLPPADEPEGRADAPDETNPEAETPPATQPPRHPR